MAWIACKCICGCRKYKHVHPIRTTTVFNGLCDQCKQHGGEMRRNAQIIVEAYSASRTRHVILQGLLNIIDK